MDREAGALSDVGEIASAVIGEEETGISVIGIEIWKRHLPFVEREFVLSEKEIEIAIAIDITGGEGLGILQTRLGQPDLAGRIRESAVRGPFEKIDAFEFYGEEIGGAVTGEIPEHRGKYEAGIVPDWEAIRSPGAFGGAANHDVGGSEDDFQLGIRVEIPNDEWINEVRAGGGRDFGMEHFGEGGWADAGAKFEAGSVDASEGVGGRKLNEDVTFQDRARLSLRIGEMKRDIEFVGIHADEAELALV